MGSLAIVVQFKSDSYQQFEDLEEESINKLIWWTLNVYQFSYSFNFIIMLVFWGFLIPFAMPREMIQSFPWYFYVSFLLMHIFPIATHVLELVANNIRLIFGRVLYPMAASALYGLIALLASPLFSTPYPMLNTDALGMAFGFVIIAAGIFLGSQALGANLTQKKEVF
eukprot:TRINITY_DN5728_c0_g1_i11.p1 TRINITY_DN5728_c0_g1~~TRINITY_DN5728_c0_g1_i11.p1  ORF type:complete len:168 (+),score=18.62 TRINITY_DN5728_c0_g1_i11:157-660(+)